ncbi:hypothetical protein SDC9_129016 [bioreactor metagenome]|uniref:Uncharacterized protein n=1 Tax=bioreactor metagenome TaxID=1076179 RepID=A0A645CYN0_9ZZZZ
MLRADHPGGIDGCGFNNLPERNAPGDQIFDLLMNMGRGAGQRAVGKTRAAAADPHRLPAQIILPLRKARRAHGVADYDGSILPQQAKRKAQYRRMDVQTVADQLGGDRVVIPRRAHRAGLPVPQARHGVKQMCHMGDARPERRPRSLISYLRVRQGHAAQRLGPGDKIAGAVVLRRDVHQPDQAPGQVVQPPKLVKVRRAHVFRLLRALFPGGDIRPLQVDAANGRALRPLFGAGADGSQRVFYALLRKGHGCGTEGGHALPHQVRRHADQGLRRGVAGIVARAAVNVKVDKARHNEAARKIHRLAVRRKLLSDVRNHAVPDGNVRGFPPEVPIQDFRVFEQHPVAPPFSFYLPLARMTDMAVRSATTVTSACS